MSLRERGLGQQEDTCLWKRENGFFRPGFITSQTWNLTRTHAPKVSWFKGVWFPEATPKPSFLTWVAAHNRLSTGDRMLKWNSQAVDSCWLCHSAIETRDHLFFECSYSADVWRGTIKGLAGAGVSVQWSYLLDPLVNGLQGRT